MKTQKVKGINQQRYTFRNNFFCTNRYDMKNCFQLKNAIPISRMQNMEPSNLLSYLFTAYEKLNLV